MRLIVAFAAFIFAGQSCFAWSEGGHHLIAFIAYDLLELDEQMRVIELLESHPNREKRFTPPESVRNPERWLIGTAAFWPDLVRKSPADRPKWHYIQQASVVVGSMEVPPAALEIPVKADLNTNDLNIVQAIKLCQAILADKTLPKESRAIALCWLCHLVGDAHQPCHAGSLYATGMFPDGDRGGNEIPTRQRKNLHALWDSLLGAKYDDGDIRRRAREIRSEGTGWTEARHDSVTDPAEWIAESIQISKVAVYTPEIMDQVRLAAANGSSVEKIVLTETYLKSAGQVAQNRAAMASYRLARSLMTAMRR